MSNNDLTDVLNDLDSAMMTFSSTIDALESWQRTSEQYAEIRQKRHSLYLGNKALDKLRNLGIQKRNYQFEYEDNYIKPESCYCHVGNAPCGYCTSGSPCELCVDNRVDDDSEIIKNERGDEIRVCDECYERYLESINP